MKNIILFYFFLFSIISFNIHAQVISCNFTGVSVYIDYNSNPFMLNATTNGMFMYDYNWTDTNGVVISSGNQTPFYTQWCLTVTDNTTGCDTIIYQDCIPNTTSCLCPFIYLPVCGCDGVMYSNSCIADCADVPWTSAISNGMLGGFLPCSTWTPTIGQPSCDVVILGDSVVCSFGNPQILTASTISGTPPYAYLWGAGQSNTPTLTINAPGTFCVTVTDANNCSATDCINVSLQDIPIFSNPTPSEICYGDSILLEFSNTPLTDIVWFPIGDTTDMIYVNPVTTTNYVVEGVDNSGCDRRGEILVSVDSCTQLPCGVEISGDSVICNWNIPQILNASSNAATTNPVTYQWYGNGMSSNSNILTINSSGTYCVTQIDANGCIDSACITVAVQDIPIYTSPSQPIICLGDSIVLEIDTLGISNITWIPNSLLTPPFYRIVDFPTFSNIYIVEAIDSAGCDRRGEIIVTVEFCDSIISCIDSSLIDPNIICLSVFDPVCGCDGIQYSNDCEALNWYGVTSWVQGPCNISTDVIDLKLELSLYPNPIKDNLKVKGNFISFSIYDIFGRKLINNYINKVIDLGSFKNGFYFVEINSSSDTIIKKIIIDK